jgi:dethiobiotin synthetase
MAAAREGQTIDFAELITFCRGAIDSAPGILFIEGIGGVMVPLDSRHTVRDWIAALEIPAILVAGTYLGTISHTLTALDALFRRNLKVLTTIVSETPNSSVPLADTVAEIARFGGPVIGLPRQRYQSGGSETQSDEKTGRTVAAFNRIFGGPGSS